MPTGAAAPSHRGQRVGPRRKRHPFRLAAVRLNLALPPPPWIIGHRGAAACALENTIPSFQRAVADGADLVELDVQLTADGRLVVAHDRTLQRIAGSPLEIEAAEFEDLRGVRFPPPAGGVSARLPALEEALAALPPAFPINLDLKLVRAPRARFATTLLTAIAGRPNVLISSFDQELLLEIRARAPGLPLAPLADRDLDSLLEGARRLDAWSVHVELALATSELIAAARGGGWPVLAYTVNHPATAAALVAAGVAGLFTDDPRALRRALALRASAPR